MKEYNIYKFRQAGKTQLIKRGVTLAEAQKICSDPETSSMTAFAPKGCRIATGKRRGMINEAKKQRWHDLQKHWFYGYAEAH